MSTSTSSTGDKTATSEEQNAAANAADTQQVIEEFWRRQNDGDYTKTVELFSEDARLVDPFYGTFEGKAAIAEFMAKMVTTMEESQTSFELLELAGDGEVAWAQWVAKTPRGNINGCGLYRVRHGKMTYYKDYMNPDGH